MTYFEFMVGVGIASFLGFCIGLFFGSIQERKSWVMRADGPTAHHANGKFYYITSESKHIRHVP